MLLFRNAAANIARMEPTKAFDPYYKWLGIPPKDQPPTHYRLLGLEEFESDLDVIESAADRQMAHLRLMQIGPHAALSQQLLNEVAAARRCLLAPALKDSYDESLRAAHQAANSVATGPGVAAEAPAPLDDSPASVPPDWNAAPTMEETADDSPAARPLWREPIVIGSAVGGLAVGAAVIAVVLLSTTPQGVEEGRKIASAAGRDGRELRKQSLDRSRSETPAVRRPGSASSKIQLERESAPSAPRFDVAAPGSPAAAAPSSPAVTSTMVAPEGRAGLPLGGSSGATFVPAPTLPEEAQPEHSQRVRYMAIGEPIDLLKRIVPARDAVNGDWHFEGEVLVSPEQLHWARLQLLADVPAEYIFTIEISRPAQRDNLSLGLVAGGSQFMYCAKAFGKGGLFLLDGKEWHVNETSYPAQDVFQAGPNTIACIVHKNGIVARVNDRTLIDWEGDFRRLSLQPYWRMPSAPTLFLGTDPRYEFTKVELQAIRTH